jgi:hypothetical protein
MVRGLLLATAALSAGLAHKILLVATAKSDMFSYHADRAAACAGCAWSHTVFRRLADEQNLYVESAMCCLPPCVCHFGGHKTANR